MPRKQSEPTNHVEKLGAKSLTIKSRNSFKHRRNYTNISNTDIDVVTAHDDTTLSKGRSDNNSTSFNVDANLLNIQDNERVASLAIKMNKVKIKKLARTIKVDQELKLERELRVAVIDGTGSTALQR